MCINGWFCSCRILKIDFTCYSDFTWNQFWGLLKCKISHFNTLRGSEFRFLWIFALCEVWNWLNYQNSEPLKFSKMVFSKLLYYSRLISRKIWMTEKYILQFHHCTWVDKNLTFFIAFFLIQKFIIIFFVLQVMLLIIGKSQFLPY